MKKYDLAVVGGGFAGTAAALAAAREGAKVIIVEKGNSLGGAAANALVHPFMNSATKIDGVRTDIAAGLFVTIREKLRERGAFVTTGNLFLEEELKFILSEMVLEANVDLLYQPIFAV